MKIKICLLNVYCQGVCLSEAESSSNTSKIERLRNLSSSFGIFQINSKLWCREGRKGGLCDKRCEDFVDDIISDDIECAKKIYEKEGFKHWKRWENKCKTKVPTIPNPLLPNISRCKYR